MTERSHAVFLSYASQDAQVAQKICEALRAGEIEVWFDQSELRGGDAWDQSIRRQIKSCALFIPVISKNTHNRDEGYFRLEWKLAVDRCHLMAADKTFLLPVVVDDTRDDDERVPERFREVQWTRLPAGETPPAFVERVRRLLTREASTTIRGPGSAQSGTIETIREPVRAAASSRARGLLVAVAVAVLGAVAYLAIDKLRISKPSVSSPTVAVSAAPAVFSPPPHSIAVLPFVNMSGEKEQEYFSDGLTEEILNSLARINELQVAARTSAFSFKAKDTDIGTIARKLNVGAILEGSVRRSGRTVRVTAQLNNAVTGFHLWSQTYDRDLKDVLQLQTEIANAVANALKVTLLGDLASKVEVGGTRVPSAFDAYLRGLRLTRVATTREEALLPLDAYSQAIGLDPNYALAYAARSLARADFIAQWTPTTVIRPTLEKARIDAERAISLAPNLGEGHAALAWTDTLNLDYGSGWRESQRALALAPGNATVLYGYSQHAAYMGHSNEAIEAAKRGVTLDPLNALSHRALGDALWFAHRYDEATAAYQDAITADPRAPESYGRRGQAYYALGNYQMARSSCEIKADNWESWLCLAFTYDKLGLRRESDAQMQKLVAFAFGGDAFAYQFAQIYAQRGDSDLALQSLDTALRLRDTGFRRLRTDPLMDPLRKEPRFQAIERGLKFPD